jgi:hypothetical protein
MIKFILILSMVGHSDFIVPQLFPSQDVCDRVASAIIAKTEELAPPTKGQITHVCYPAKDAE